MILVTGASGFLGMHLLEALVEKGFKVRALYHSQKPTWQHPLVEWHACDLLDVYAVADIMQSVSQVYHCAAIVSFDKKDRDRVIDQNRMSTAHVVDEAMNAGVKKLLYVSSIAALGRAAKEENLINENTEWQDSKTNTAYAVGKYQAEMEVWRGIAEGLNAVIVNPGIILGEGDYNKGSAKLFTTTYNELAWTTEGVNGWVDAKDVVQAMLLLMQSEVNEERFILTEGNHSYKSVFTLMAEALHKKAPTKVASPFLSKLIARLSELKSFFTGKPSTITKETARTALAKSFYDNGKIKKFFPEFEFQNLSQTINRVAQDFLNKI